MPEFVVERLSPDRISLAFPLIREMAPTLDVRRWTHFARRIADPRRAGKQGVLVVTRRARPWPCGLVCYRLDHDFTHTSILNAEYFVALDLLDQAAALTALIGELEALGRRMGCGAIRSLPHPDSADVLSGLLSAGHQYRGSVLVKVLDP